MGYWAAQDRHQGFPRWYVKCETSVARRSLRSQSISASARKNGCPKPKPEARVGSASAWESVPTSPAGAAAIRTRASNFAGGMLGRIVQAAGQGGATVLENGGPPRGRVLWMIIGQPSSFSRSKARTIPKCVDYVQHIETEVMSRAHGNEEKIDRYGVPVPLQPCLPQLTRPRGRSRHPPSACWACTISTSASSNLDA